MYSIWENLSKIVSQNIMVHIYSSPIFSMEIFIGIVMCIIHCLLILEVNKLIQNVHVPPLKMKMKQTTKGADLGAKQHNVFSAFSFLDWIFHNRINKTATQKHPDLGVGVIFKDNALISDEWDTMTKINKILSTKLSDYIRNGKGVRSKASLESINGHNNTDEMIDTASEIETIATNDFIN